MSSKDYYEQKKTKLELKLQTLNNDTFTSYITLSTHYFTMKNEIEAELIELNQLIQENTMSDETQVAEEATADVVTDDSVAVESESSEAPAEEVAE